ncbi:MAG TPA: lipid-A-disaccharide synthase [Pseudomonadales bacterium]|nr:lipid-A-disaccharide synthase [Pseudomonadales bacterium]
MSPKTFLLIAGEPSGDLLASELVTALRDSIPGAHFIGAGGPRMAAAGVELSVDMMAHAMVGIPTVGKYFALRRLSHELLTLARERKADAIIGVDYGGFNLRFGHLVKEYVRNNQFGSWNPKLVQFVSPQVWASRPGRAKQLEADYDLLLSIFPFEKEWYAKRVPKLRVEFVGHPLVDRIQKTKGGGRKAEGKTILLLPGSRKSELYRHLPVMLGALEYIRGQVPGVRAKMVLPNEQMKSLAAKAEDAGVEIQTGNVPEALTGADLAITKTGTVTMECAFFGVPAVTIYKKSLLGLAIDLGIITVKSLTMPNLMADEAVYPEFLAEAATAENVALAALRLLRDESRREHIKAQLASVVASLGEPGASRRAAAAVLSLFK